MTRPFATFIIVAILILTAAAGSLGAQGRGGGFHPGVFGARPGAVMRGPAPVVAAPGSVFVGRGPGHVFGPPIVGGSRVTIVRPQRGIIVGQPFIGGYPSVVGQPFIGTYPSYVWGSSYYPPYNYTPSPYIAPNVEPSYVTPSVTQSQNEADLAYQVQRLSQEIEQLRAEQSSAAAVRQLPPPPQASVPERPATPTTLVFRDGHRLVIQNYAIVGPTLWVLEERSSSKISLSELDLEATQRENRGQGVRFPLPEK